jgi:hypothetical protein
MSVDGEDEKALSAPIALERSTSQLSLSAPIALERVTSHMSTTSYLSLEEQKPTGDGAAKAKKRKEASSFQLSNPSRLTPSQARFISLGDDQRYIPIAGHTSQLFGVVMLVDTDSSAPENVTKVERLTLNGNEEIAAAPEPFEWDPSDP